jgi:hypothetical protein
MPRRRAGRSSHYAIAAFAGAIVVEHDGDRLRGREGRRIDGRQAD